MNDKKGVVENISVLASFLLDISWPDLIFISCGKLDLFSPFAVLASFSRRVLGRSW